MAPSQLYWIVPRQRGVLSTHWHQGHGKKIVKKSWKEKKKSRNAYKMTSFLLMKPKKLNIEHKNKK